MGVFSTTMKAYWRESPDERDCTCCGASGVRTWQTGHKPRGAREVCWWDESRWCDGCKGEGLPDTAPE